MRKTLRLVVCLSFLALPWSACAALCGLILCNCTASTTSVAFGSYNPLSPANHDGTGAITVSCTGVGLIISYTIALDTGGGGSYLPRKMVSGVNHLNYNLYTDNTYSTIWGNGIGTGTVSYAMSLLLIGSDSKEHVVYGRMPGSQSTVAPGTYTDTVHVTVTYN